MRDDGMVSSINSRLASIRDSGLLRQAPLVESRSGVKIRVNGNDLINFCSNDYLGLASHPRLAKAMEAAAVRYGTGSTASPLVCGKTNLHQTLEERLAAHYGLERAVLFSCGYMANQAAIAGLTETASPTLFIDKYCHASTVDAVRSSHYRRYPHLDMDALERRLGDADRECKLVLTESVFSMDGDVAPLDKIAACCSEYAATLIVDDAHGLGVLGAHGRGGLDHFGLTQGDIGLVMATFGKSLGVHGAVLAGKAEIIELIVQTARPYIYSTSLPVPIVAAVDEALSVLEEEQQHHEKLMGHIARFTTGLNAIGIAPLSNTPIQPLIVGEPDAAMALSALLKEQGFFVSAIRPPTVPVGTSRLRVTLTAAHNEAQIDRLLDAVASSCHKLDYTINRSIR